MILTEFIQSSEFTSTEKLIIVYMLHKNNSEEFEISLKDMQPLIGISYVTAQKSLKNLTEKKVLSASLVRNNTPTKYVILLD
jgi:hypothetical protein